MASIKKIDKSVVISLDCKRPLMLPPIPLIELLSIKYPNETLFQNDFTDVEKDIADLFEQIGSSYITSLNLHKDSLLNYNSTWDIVDYYEHDTNWHDLYEHTEWSKDKINLFWLSNEHTRFITPEGYLIDAKRLGYDKEHEEVKYELEVEDLYCMHTREGLFAVPVSYMEIGISVVDVLEVANPCIHFYRATTYSNFNKFAKKVIEGMTDAKGGAAFRKLGICILKCINDMEFQCYKGDREFSSLIPLAANFLAHTVVYNQQLAKKGNLSRPKAEPRTSKPKSINHVVTDVLKPRVRTLGDNKISVYSNTRPRVEATEKVIHYAVGTWGRCEHLRHYKSGKVVLIKSSTCHRRCVDIDENIVSPGTIYRMKDNRGEQNV